MKPKASTMQERMGFSDPDLKSPIHDEMVIWLMNNRVSVANYILGQVGVWSRSHSVEDRKRWSEELNLFDPATIVKTEHPVMSRDFIVGFIDIVISRRDAYPDRVDNGTLLSWKWCTEVDSKIFIEVKPKIESFGETMRQVNMYREYLSGTYAIFTPDHRFKDAFESQGIKVFKSTDVPLIG